MRETKGKMDFIGGCPNQMKFCYPFGAGLHWPLKGLDLVTCN
jgi:hypothetical protein